MPSHCEYTSIRISTMDWQQFVLLLIIIIALSVVLIRDKDNKILFEVLRVFRQSLRYTFELLKSNNVKVQVYNFTIKFN